MGRVSCQIKSFTTLAVLGRSVYRVCVAHLSVFSLPGNTATFEEMLQRWQAVVNTLSDLTGLRFEAQTSPPEKNAIPLGLLQEFSSKDILHKMVLQCSSLRITVFADVFEVAIKSLFVIV